MNKDNKNNRNLLRTILAYAILSIVLWSMFGMIGLVLQGGFKYIADGRVQVSEKMLNNSVIEFVEFSTFQDKLDAKEVVIVFYDQSQQYLLYVDDSCEEVRDLSQDEMITYSYLVKDLHKTFYPANTDWRKSVLLSGSYIYMLNSGNSKADAFVITEMIITVGLLLLVMTASRKMFNVTDGESFQLATSDVKFADIIGIEEITDQLQGLVEVIKDEAKMKKNPMHKFRAKDLGYKASKGILLCGPGGVGKTMIAKAIACEADLPFFSCSGSDFVQLYVGMGAKRIRKLFKEARAKAPCIIFIDEFDALAKNRSSYDTNGEYGQTVDAFLKEMDGFSDRTGVFVLAATNYPDKLDKAATRSGRFDRRIDILPPRDWKVRAKMFDKYLEGKPLDETVNIDMLARTTTGLTGADIATVCNEAAFIALTKEKTIISQDDINEAIDNKVFNGSRSKREQSAKDIEVIAYHEAGHAVMKFLNGQEITRASVMGTTSGVGGAVFGGDTDEHLKFSKAWEQDIEVCYAGQISERIKFQDVTQGASNDIEKATQLLNSYVGTYGFDTTYGYVNVHDMIEYAGEGNIDISDKIRNLSMRLYDHARIELQSHYYMVEALAKELIENGELIGDEIVKIIKDARCGVVF